ncbi:hypothetical protein [Xanthomonas arboricola]|uniref:hypothetical protein n=1 Tax=Xanthomonas arboricola TaxID=56448 RepID=UPI0011B023C4|nr:hypothetical protein [Xanthomonas arboricola]
MAAAFASCSTTSVDDMRAAPADATYTSAKPPAALSECVVAAFNDNARGFEAIQFDGAKAYANGPRYTVAALTNYPTYILDITPSKAGGSVIEERTTLRAGFAVKGYLPRFRALTSGCL